MQQSAQPGSQDEVSKTTHSLVQFELLCSDAAAASERYGLLFDWEISKKNALHYPLINTGRPDIPGGLGSGASRNRGTVLFFQSDDLHADLAAAESIGGVPTMPVLELLGVRSAQFRDPAGNSVGLWNTPRSLVGESSGHDLVVGFEIAGHSSRELHNFYETLFGWNVDEDSFVDTGSSIGRFVDSYHAFTGIVVQTSDIESTTKAAFAQGCERLAGPDTWVNGAELRRFCDPDNNVFAITPSK